MAAKPTRAFRGQGENKTTLDPLKNQLVIAKVSRCGSVEGGRTPGATVAAVDAITEMHLQRRERR